MDSTISKILEFIDKNIEKRITLKKAADLSRLSPGYLSALFKKKMGLCFGKHLKEKRIEKARLLLANAEIEIKNIPAAVGY
jgi:two-component system response regulator YesN